MVYVLNALQHSVRHHNKASIRYTVVITTPIIFIESVTY